MNPMDGVFLYAKKRPDEVIQRTPPEMVSLMLPGVFCECVLRFFWKKTSYGTRTADCGDDCTADGRRARNDEIENARTICQEWLQEHDIWQEEFMQEE
ncbi:hypothetical protein LSAT2_028485 [Lamellibrachia satsuma]|nr:hypothetical protein LSAT2_028485 [Lamellibrachia satsuma]